MVLCQSRYSNVLSLTYVLALNEIATWKINPIPIGVWLTCYLFIYVFINLSMLWGFRGSKSWNWAQESSADSNSYFQDLSYVWALRKFWCFNLRYVTGIFKNINGQIFLANYTSNISFNTYADNGAASFAVDESTGHTESPVNRSMSYAII